MSRATSGRHRRRAPRSTRVAVPLVGAAVVAGAVWGVSVTGWTPDRGSDRASTGTREGGDVVPATPDAASSPSPSPEETWPTGGGGDGTDRRDTAAGTGGATTSNGATVRRSSSGTSGGRDRTDAPAGDGGGAGGGRSPSPGPSGTPPPDGGESSPLPGLLPTPIVSVLPSLPVPMLTVPTTGAPLPLP